MTSFDYLMVMPGVVAALSLGRLLKGVALVLPGWWRSKIEMCWLPLAWAAILFGLQVQYWHAMRSCVDEPIANGLLQYLLLFISPIMIYLASAVLMPTELRESGSQARFSLIRHYYDHGTLFFGICSIGILLEVAFSDQLQCKAANSDLEDLYRGIAFCITGVLAVTARIENANARARAHAIGTVIGGLWLWAFIAEFR